MANSSAHSIAILGAGVTGLTAAFRLTQRGHRVKLFEASGRVGGAIRTERMDGWLIESGPNSLLADPIVSALVEELGLGRDRLNARPSARNRFIVRAGKPVAAPLSPPALLRSPLFSAGAKFRIMREILQRPRVRPHDVSLSAFVRDHFGQELVDYALNPFVSGVYAGDPGKLSTRHAFPKLWEWEQTHGSLLRGQIKAAKASGQPRAEIISFRDGLQALPEAIARQLPPGTLVPNTRIEALTPHPLGWHVLPRDSVSDPDEVFNSVVLALPAPALAALRLEPSGVRPLAALERIEHPPVSSLFLGFRRDDVAHPLDGFGMLVPEVERRAILGVLFSSTLFPGRAPADHVALTVLVGGTRNPEIARLPTEALIAAVRLDLLDLLGVRGDPVFHRHTFWPRAIPQYTVGYEEHLETIARVERSFPRLWIGGQARDGISLPACLAAGQRLAGRIA